MFWNQNWIRIETDFFFEELDLEPVPDSIFVWNWNQNCSNKYVLELEPEVLHNSQELPNSGMDSRPLVLILRQFFGFIT
jgi:hypothetical protein